MMTDTISRIQDNLYLGNLNALRWVSSLPEKEQKEWCTVTILSPQELRSIPFAFPKHTYKGLIIKADDSPNVPLNNVFQKVADFCEECLQKNKKVLVHCMMGISRSTACVVSYLMLKKGMTFMDALSLVRRKRPCVSPNPGFLKQLQELNFQVASPR
ncbi:dual specificity phosphatase [Noumeavirus]|uniref:dual specificity phosphatase n=1 Tax=Noumeavirus TaxID=1955558 RepID=UPI000982CD62|nr:dual specificity phosphatase [Noumeavirus]AQM73370.1 dual specificity phosphatase [Noumeavirus]